ncbi:glycosyltransferase family 2 protein, partial [Candidatus Cloacimonadota bacterium]
MQKENSIAVVIPAYNEAAQIGSVIKTIPEFVDWIIVVDDGSKDDTGIISRNSGAILVTHSKNKGVGAAFKSGLDKAIDLNADIMINIDADGQFNPDDITKIIAPIVNDEAEFVTASRFINKEYYPRMSKIKFLGNKFMSWFISRLTDNIFYDVSCGFRAYSRKAMIQLNLFGDFTYTQETFIDLSLKGIIIKEVPLHVR